MSIILAILCAIVAHLFHAARWGLFITPFGETRKSYLYYSLSIGYLVNLVVPFRIGELARAFLLYKKTQINFSYILGTVIFDRIFDIIFISIVFACLLLTNIIKDFAFLDYVIFSTGIVFFLFLILKLKIMRKIIYQVSDIFNDRIKLIILSFSWSLYTITRILLLSINKRTFFIYTFAMWIFYIASLSNLVWFFSTEDFSVYFKPLFIQVYSLEVHQQSFAYWLAQSISSFSDYSLIMTFCIIIFIWSTPLMIIIGYAYSRETIEKRENILSKVINRSRGIFFQENGKLKILPFSEKIDQLKFLNSFFISENIENIIAIHEINRNVIILQDLSGGSGATTNLIIKDKNLLVRKYALGSVSHKLKIQYQWLKKYQQLLPVTKLVGYTQENNCFLYDMEYDSACLSFFNYIHSHSINESWSIIESIFNVMESKLYSGTEQKSLESNLQSYIEKKYIKTFEIINSNQKLSRLYNYETITINGNEYKNLKYFKKYFSIEYLTKLLFNHKCSEIHGDITIENIVYLKDSFDRYYLIDPNPENIYNHKYIDYAKMRQSLNMGFEYLNSVPYVYCTENIIEFPFTITDRYVKLLERFDQYVHSQFDNKGFKNVLFHEIVNYARLLPYKFILEPDNTIMYYAIFLMLHNSYYDQYYEK